MVVRRIKKNLADAAEKRFINIRRGGRDYFLKTLKNKKIYILKKKWKAFQEKVFKIQQKKSLPRKCSCMSEMV